MVGYNGTYYWVDYDEIGNPVRYGYGESDSDYMEDGYELTWDGRELVAFRQCSDFDSLTYVSNITYTYNADGIRTSKTVNGIKHEYYLSGSQIIAEVWVENNVEHMLIYVYDEVGSPIALRYRNDSYAYDQFDTFFFEKNLQGDIIAIYNELGEKIGSYLYDAWGNHTAKTISGNTTLENNIVNSYNPFRYRGYYYDVETGFYYLQSRYYSPEWCRFLNPDSIMAGTSGTLHGHNLYAYCFNNPIMMDDLDGNWPKWLKKVGKAIKEGWDNTTDFIEDTFGCFVDTTVKIVDPARSMDCLFAAYERGTIIRDILGDDSKPICSFITNEGRIGIQINIGKRSYSASFGREGATYSVTHEGSTTYGMIGLDKIGWGTSYTQNGITLYEERYIRPRPTAVAIVIPIVAPQLIPEIIVASYAFAH